MEIRNPKLTIDLNAEPKDSGMHYVAMDPTNLVKKYHGVLPPVTGNAVEEPGLGGQVPNCGLCNKAIQGNNDIVCDACDQSFHVACVKLRPKQASAVEDWLCPNCVRDNGGSQRWPLGPLGDEFRRILGFKGSSDDGGTGASAGGGGGGGSDGVEGATDLAGVAETPKKVGGDAASCEERVGITVELPGKDVETTTATVISRSKNVANGFTSERPPEMTPRMSKIDTDKQFLNTKLRDTGNSNNASSSLSDDEQFDCGDSEARRMIRLGDEYMQKLRDYVSQRKGVLSNGWAVEVKKRSNNHDYDVTYYSPDRQKCRSRVEVARYLGLSGSNSVNSTEDAVQDNASTQKRLPSSQQKASPSSQQKALPSFQQKASPSSQQKALPSSQQKALPSSSLPRKRKELARRKCIDTTLAKVQSCIMNDEINGSSESEDHSSEMDMDPSLQKVKRKKRECGSIAGDSDLQQKESKVELPVQYEDFSIECLGAIDPRPAYHDNFHIWPVGYQSTWHDTFTGSLFKSEVHNGGIAGPIFRVTRHPCTALPDTSTSTVLLLSSCRSSEFDDTVEEHYIHSETSYELDNEIEMLLVDPEDSISAHICAFQKEFTADSGNDLGDDIFTSSLNIVATENVQSQGKIEQENSVMKSLVNDIGEFSVESRSSSEAWRLIARRFVEACLVVYQREKRLQLVCDHLEAKKCRSERVAYDSQAKKKLAFLRKLCSSAGPGNMLNAIHSESGLVNSCRALMEWLEQDRFGLDMPFVQEFIEGLPQAEKCLNYEFLTKRKDYATSQTVGNGVLILKKRPYKADEPNEETIHDLLRQTKKARREMLLGPQKSEERAAPPPGRPFESKLSPEMVGDVIQVWELLWRFYEILGEKEPPSLEELEEELADPWPEDSKFIEKSEKQIKESREFTSPSEGGDKGNFRLRVNNEPDTPICSENGNEDISFETGPPKETGHSRVTTTTYVRCNGVALARAHVPLLKVLLTELQSKIAAVLEPNIDIGEVKKRGRKKELESITCLKKSRHDIPPVNEITWPELARRYILAVSAFDLCGDVGEMSTRDAAKILRCIQGDGGVLCGALHGVVGMEVDAQLLAEAEKNVSANVSARPVIEKDGTLNVGGAKNEDKTGSEEKPDWAEVLEPVRKLPTNVGTRIRKCVYEALERNPPEWAREILEWSISKPVYKGNASGPTKKAVLSILEKFSTEEKVPKPRKTKKVKIQSPKPEIIMKRCRIVLRCAAAADEGKVFCNLLGVTLLNPNDNDEEGMLGPPAMVSRPLDFRTIDLRLAAGAYGESHEAFLADVREVWKSIHTACGDRSNLRQLAESLSKTFESLYEKEVLSLFKMNTEDCGHNSQEEVKQANADSASQIGGDLPKAPWEEGVCKVCGIDKDDDSVLLCDTCDSEYHTYCLNPPLAKIPEGNWYCPSCVAGQDEFQEGSASVAEMPTETLYKKKYKGTETRALFESRRKLALSLAEKEYWQLSVEERLFLLKFLCEEALSSVMIHEHLDQCTDLSLDLQQKLRYLTTEWKNLKAKEELQIVQNMKLNANKVCTTDQNPMEINHMVSFASLNEGIMYDDVCKNVQNISRALSVTGGQVANMELENGIQGNGSVHMDKHVNYQYLQCESGKPHIPTDQDCLPSHIGQVDGHECSNMLVSNESSDAGKEQMTETVSFGKSLENMDQDGRQKSEKVEITIGQVNGIGHIIPVTIAKQQNMTSPSESNTNSLGQSNALILHETVEKMKEVIQFASNFKSTASVVETQDIEHPRLMDIDNTRDNLPTQSVEELKSQEVQLDREIVFQGNDALPVSIRFPERQDKLNLQSPIQSEIQVLQEAISSLEAQLCKVSIRRELLGRDGVGRLYWALSRHSKHPWLVVEGVTQAQKKGTSLAENLNEACLGMRSFQRGSADPMCHSDKSLLQNTSGHCTSNFGERIEQTENKSKELEQKSGEGDDIISSWVSYETDEEIEKLLSWLSESNQRERELKTSIVQWQKLRSQQSRNAIYNCNYNHMVQAKQLKSNSKNAIFPSTRAVQLLKKKFGRCLESENSEARKRRGRKPKVQFEERMHRCECLEPVWLSRSHCFSCHETFFSSSELHSHNDGKCALNTASVQEDAMENDLAPKVKKRKGGGGQLQLDRVSELVDSASKTPLKKGSKTDQSSKSSKLKKKKVTGNPAHDFMEISKKFIIPCSNKDLVRGIGLIASDGVASFISAPYFSSLLDPSLLLYPPKQDGDGIDVSAPRIQISASAIVSRMEQPHVHAPVDASHTVPTSSFPSLHLAVSGEKNEHEIRNAQPALGSDMGNARNTSMLLKKAPPRSIAFVKRILPEASTKPLLERMLSILRRLKINLLDMDAALPEEVLEPSKASLTKRRSWRAFVKSAKSIFEMVEATIILEQMIKTERLRNVWWYWSSYSAAVKTSTMSALALRIYALDAAIMYRKASGVSEPADTSKLSKPCKRKKDEDG